MTYSSTSSKTFQTTEARNRDILLARHVRNYEPAHLEKGHEQYSFNLVEGIGLSDGKCSKHVWGSHNPLAGSTRTMGPGT